MRKRLKNWNQNNRKKRYEQTKRERKKERKNQRKNERKKEPKKERKKERKKEKKIERKKERAGEQFKCGCVSQVILKGAPTKNFTLSKFEFGAYL